MNKIHTFILLFLLFSVSFSKPQKSSTRFSITDDEDVVIDSSGDYNNYELASGEKSDGQNQDNIAETEASGNLEYDDTDDTEIVQTSTTTTVKTVENTEETVEIEESDDSDEFEEILTPSIDFNEKEEKSQEVNNQEEQEEEDDEEVIYEATENLDETELEIQEENVENYTESFDSEETPTVSPIDEDYFSPPPEEETRIVDIIDLSSVNQDDQGIFSWINDFWGEKYFLAALLAGAIIGFIIISLVILFICYTVRKADEGSYTIPKNNNMTTLSKYGHSVVSQGGGTAPRSTLGAAGQEYKYKAPEFYA